MAGFRESEQYCVVLWILNARVIADSLIDGLRHWRVTGYSEVSWHRTASGTETSESPTTRE
jgi:hypothetical protein